MMNITDVLMDENFLQHVTDFVT
jgi:uncharacterized membrane protein